MSEAEITMDARELVRAIDKSINDAIERALHGHLFYFKECMNDMLADMSVINHEIGLLRRHLDMEKSLFLSLNEIPN